MGGWFAFLWGFVLVFIGGVIIYKKLVFDLESMYENNEEEWD